jgi:hypothetical protein
MHCLALFIVVMLLIFRWIWLFIQVPNRQVLRTNKHEKYSEQVKRCEEFERDLKVIDRIRIPEPGAKPAVGKMNNRFIELIPIVFLLTFYVIYGIIIWSIDDDFTHAYPRKVILEQEYSQGVYFPLAWTLVLS